MAEVLQTIETCTVDCVLYEYPAQGKVAIEQKTKTKLLKSHLHGLNGNLGLSLLQKIRQSQKAQSVSDMSFIEARWRNSFTTRQSHFTPRQSPDVKIKYRVTSVRMFIKKVKQTTTSLLATDCFVQVLFDFLGFLSQPPHLEQKILEYILDMLHDHLC
jgi:hypothetical protein